MFDGCTNLVGEKGTVYGIKDASYAHIDGGPDNPGYFSSVGSEKPAVPYCLLSEDNSTLTLYYGKDRVARGGKTFGGKFSFEEIPWSGSNETIVTVVIDATMANCTSIVSADRWFCGCVNLKKITGLENLKTENVTGMSSMFANCSSLETLDLSNFNTANVKNMYSMFYGCSSLETIYVSSGWTTAKVSARNGSKMFIGCERLVGGQGTVYDASKTTYLYACIDGGPDAPGYFTYKATFTKGDVNVDMVVDVEDVVATVNIILGE